MPEPDFIRVRLNASGAETTIDAPTFLPEHMTRLDKPAVDEAGRPLPAKTKTAIDDAPGAEQARTRAHTAAAKKTTAAPDGGDKTGDEPAQPPKEKS